MKCVECGRALYITEETIIHRRIDGKNLHFHPKCWRIYLSSMPISDTAGLIDIKNPQSSKPKVIK